MNQNQTQNPSHLESDLQTLVTKGKTQGYLTYDDVNGYLPDQDINPEKLDNLLVAIDEAGIELLDAPPPGPGDILRFPTKEVEGPTLANKSTEPPTRWEMMLVSRVSVISCDLEKTPR